MFMAGCAGGKRAPVLAPVPDANGASSPQAIERLVTRRASMTVRVADVPAAAGRVEGIVTQAEGMVTESARTDGERATFALRVPSTRLEGLLDQLATLGRPRDRTVTARDVTEQAIDLDARLQNKRALRDRLRALLSSTTVLQEVLAVEDQLARLQAEIDTLEGQSKRLHSEVALSSVELSLERETKLGPLGLVFHGLWWGLRHLFVWQ
jgi:hypothetical protein